GGAPRDTASYPEGAGGPPARRPWRDKTTERPGGPALPAPRASFSLPAGNDRRRLQLAADDLLLQLGDLSQPRLLQMCLRADLPEPDPAVLQVEDEVLAAPVALAALGAFDGEIDPVVHPLHGTREDVRAEVGLVDVHADAPAARFLRCGERAEAAGTGDAEPDLRAGVELVLRDALALRLVDEVLRVADLHRRPGHAPLRAGLVARQERVDRRDLEAADDADV